MAESVRSLFDYREPPTLDSDGEGSKPVPPRGRVCGRKRKGTPVKVCDRVFATEDEEESLSEHSFCPGDGQYQQGEEDRCAPGDGSYYLTDPSQLCVSELGDEGGSGPRSAILYPPPPNCRIREVHCGSQVRLVVIAIRDISKGEEITVDYSLTEWGENAMGFHSAVSPGGFECSSDHENNIKKEEEPGPVSLSDYLTPSWSLSPSSSPLSRSEPSDSDEEDEEEEEEEEVEKAQRTRLMCRRKRRRTAPVTAAKKKRVGRGGGTGRPLSFARTTPGTHSLFKQPIPGMGRGKAVGGAGGVVTLPIPPKQKCQYCGRHFRSLPRHLEKHHSQQPDVRAAMERSNFQLQTRPLAGPAHPTSSSTTPSLFPSTSSASLSLSPPPPPTQQRPATPKKSPAHSPPPRKSPAPNTTPSPSRKGPPPPLPPPPLLVAVPKKSPTPSTPPRKGRRMKKEKEEPVVGGEPKESQEQVPRPVSGEHEKEKEGEDQQEKVEVRENTKEEKNEETSSPGRLHMMSLLSSLSTLVLYLRRLQHSAYLSLTHAPRSAEAWRLLCHSSLALLVLYNRRRECEASKLTLQEYRARCKPQSPGTAPPTLTPLEASLSPFERQVLPHLARVGVQGKRGRVQPLILPPSSEACLELLMHTRPGVGVDPHNPYLFARPFHSPATPLRGTDLLRSLARSSGARNPRALTQTRLRRQVAILTQLLMLSEGEGPEGAAVRRLETFLQREYHVTQSCAGIGQDPGLMGRVARVVLCGERDGVLFRGMSLHHICLELDVMSGNSADSFSDDSDGERGASKAKTGVAKKATANGRPKKGGGGMHLSSSGVPVLLSRSKKGSGQSKTGKRGVLKRPWSEAERAAVESHLSRNIMELRVPAKADCERCLQQCPLLVSNCRDWRSIKFYCHNRIQLVKKRERRESLDHVRATI